MRPAVDRVGFALLFALAAACSGDKPPPAPIRGALASGVAATVGPDAVSVQTVERIAQAQHIAPSEARHRAVEDALFALGARARFRNTGRVTSAENAVLARRLLEQLKSQAQAQGPASDAEIARLTERHWYDLDRPESVRTTHAVVLVNKPADDAPAKALAERILAAVDGVHDAAAFKKSVEALPTGGLQVKVQNLPPVAADGRVVPDEEPPPGAKPRQFDRTFAQAANAISSVGEHSPVIHTRFGYHVILLDERLPPKRVPLEQRKKELAAEVIDARAHAAEQKLLEQLRASTPIQVVRAFDDLTSRVRVDR